MSHAQRTDAPRQGLIILVSAPSGAGKTSLVRGLMERDDSLRMGISHTTRPRRGAEREGRDYYFVSEEKFNEMRACGEFLECAEVFGHMYGTSRRMIDAFLQADKDVILEIDWQGAAQLRRKHFADASVFIVPPRIESLASRLSGRGSDAETVIQGRLRAARHEIAHFADYDYLLVNEDFDRAVDALGDIIRAERCRTSKVGLRRSKLIEALLDGTEHG